MKAKTKFEKECMNITFDDVNFDYLFNDNFKYKGFYNIGKCICGKCGNINEVFLDSISNVDAFYENKDPCEFFRCKYCNAGNHIEINGRARKYFKRYWIEKLEFHNDIQVSRIFCIEVIYNKYKKMEITPVEAIRYFFKDNKFVVGSINWCLCNYTWTYSKDSSFSIKTNRTQSYYVITDIAVDFIHPDIQILDKYKYIRYIKFFNLLYFRKGYYCTFLDAFKAYNYNSKIYEIIIEDERFEFVGCYNKQNLIEKFIFDEDKRIKIIHFFNSIRIALKHDYRIKDFDLYLDYLCDLEELGLDLYNPYYLCPSNLRKAHSKTIEQLKHLNEIKAVELFSPLYNQLVERFLNIDIGDSNISIVVLPDVQSFKEEGDKMHHCVFVRKYYKKIVEKVLILSARDRKTGDRIETVELDLNKGEVLQSRGIHNTSTKFHKQIINLVENNYKLLKEGIL